MNIRLNMANIGSHILKKITYLHYITARDPRLTAVLALVLPEHRGYGG